MEQFKLEQLTKLWFEDADKVCLAISKLKRQVIKEHCNRISELLNCGGQILDNGFILSGSVVKGTLKITFTGDFEGWIKIAFVDEHLREIDGSSSYPFWEKLNWQYRNSEVGYTLILDSINNYVKHAAPSKK